MFTGLIRTQGKVVKHRKEQDGCLLVIEAENTADIADIAIGDSIAVHGVCLTCTDQTKHGSHVQLTFFVSPETLSCTRIGHWSCDTPVHLELAAQVGQRLDGHVVLGHVDGIGMVRWVNPMAGGQTMRVDLHESVVKELGIGLAPKGSIAVDGVSLTMNEIFDDDDGVGFAVMLIPHTLEHTQLSKRVPRDYVHIEIDPMARYLARIVPHYLSRVTAS